MFKKITLVILAYFSPLIAIAQTENGVEGEYKVTEYNYSLNIVFDKDSQLFDITLGDITEGIENIESGGLSYCLLASSIHILIPNNLLLGAEFNCRGTRVKVLEKINLNQLGIASNLEVYLLSVFRPTHMVFEDHRIQIGDSEYVYELLYSSEFGLVGFKVLSNETDTEYFLRDDLALRQTKI